MAPKTMATVSKLLIQRDGSESQRIQILSACIKGEIASVFICNIIVLSTLQKRVAAVVFEEVVIPIPGTL